VIIEEIPPARSSHRSVDTAALVALLIAFLWIRWDGVQVASTHLIGGATRDAGLYYWLVRDFAIAPLIALWGESSAFYPYGLSRAWSDNFLIPSMISWVFTACGLGAVLSYNLLLLGAGFANGACTFLALRSVRLSATSSFCGALAFQSLSYFTTNLGHPQLQFAFFLPLAVLISVRLVRSPNGGPALAFGLLLSTSLLTTAYYSIFVALVGFMTATASLLLNAERPAMRARWRQLLLVACGVAPALLAAPFYAAVGHVFSSRGLYEAYYFSAQPFSFFSYGPFHRYFSGSASWSHPEGWLGGGAALLLAAAIAAFLLRRIFTRPSLLCFVVFIGSLAFLTLWKGRIVQGLASWTLVLSAMGIVWCWRRRGSEPDRSAALFIATAFLCFTLGTALAFGPLGNPEKGHYPLGIFAAFYAAFPGFDALRAVARFGLLGLMGLSLVTAGALDAVSLRYSSGGRILALLLCVAILFEAQHSAFPIETVPPAPQLLQTEIPEGSRAIFLPLSVGTKGGSVESWGEYARLATTFMIWGAERGLKIVNGYSGQRSKLMLELPADTESFPSKRSMLRLSSIAGLEFIVVVASEMRDPLWRSRIAEYSEQLGVVSEDPAGNLLLRFSPRLSVGPESPTALLLPANGAALVKVTLDGAPECPTRWGLAESPAPSDLRFALDHGQHAFESELTIRLAHARFNIRPRVLALDSPCPKTLTSSRIEVPAEAW
jgi:hypothetical protein